MEQFIIYPDARWNLREVHVRGKATGHCLEATAFTLQGEKLVAQLPRSLPHRELVTNERERVSAPSPLSGIRAVAKLAGENNLHFLCILSFETAHILEDLPIPEQPFFEFFIAECDLAPLSERPELANLKKQVQQRAECPTVKLVGNTSDRFVENFEKSRANLLCGDVFEIVLSRRFQFEADPKNLFAFLAQEIEDQKAPYRFALHFCDTSVVGASPELLVRVEQGRVTNRPISGSMRRTSPGEQELSTEEKDQWEVLLHSEKEKSELDMLIDLARHDLNRVCNNVNVSAYREALLLETVVHTQATVEGDLKPGLNAFDALFSCLNAGTLVGAPKKKAMELIAQLEPEPRGFYGGNLVHVDPSGQLRSTILIRTCVLQGSVATVQAGATVLLDSTAEYEYWECGAKARKLLSTFGREDLCYLNAAPPPIVNFGKVAEPLKFAQSAFANNKGKFPVRRLLLVDNEDSFTFNLAALFESFGCELTVVRNHVPPEHLLNLKGQLNGMASFDGLVLSPGPASPREAGYLLDYVKQAAGNLPVFGVCLGFQAMVEALGGTLGKMTTPLHGKCRDVFLVKEHKLTASLPRIFPAARYHSLFAAQMCAPLELLAEDENQVPLALTGPAHWPAFFGVQFHPESFLTGAPGSQLCENWLAALSD